MTMIAREALKRASSLLKKTDGSQAVFTAELFLRHVLGWDRTAWIMNLEHPLSRAVWKQTLSAVRRRRQGEPVQYILGRQEFYGLPFRVSPSVLIPRPDTEIVVESVIHKVRERFGRDEPLVLADIGTGSGAIAVVLASHFPRARVMATDLSEQALALAEENATANGVRERIEWWKGDLLTPLIRRHQQVDVLISNPPYIRSGDMASLQAQVRGYEPRMALDGGEDGLRFYRELTRQADRILKPSSLVALEVGVGQAPQVARLLLHCDRIRETAVQRDLAGIERGVLGIGERF